MASIDLLQELKLNDYYPQKLSFHEAIKLRGESQTGGEEQYGLEIVRRLLLFDSETVVSVTTELNKRLNNTSVNEVDNKVECDAEVGRLPGKSNVRPSWRKVNAKQNEPKLHPMDLLVVVMNCCDDFLRQVLVEKMFTNTLSIPILLPSVRNGSHRLLLFALRSLVPEVQGLLGESLGTMADTLVDVSGPFVSFIRVGDLHRSKSKLVNDVFNLNPFNTFFHRECPNGSAKRSVSMGSIEAAWFQSSKATEEEFNCKFLTALNLRGDAKNYSKQTQFLCHSSTLTVFMVNCFELFKDLYESVLKDVNVNPKKIIVSYMSPVSPDKVDDTFFRFLENLEANDIIFAVIYDWHDGARKMSDDDFTNELRNTISNFLEIEQSSTIYRRITKYATFIESGKNFTFSLDEDAPECQTGKTSADVFINLVLEQPFNCKPTILPLQGQPWINIGKLDREQRAKSQNQNQDEYFIARKETEKRQQRQMQCHNLIHPNAIALQFFLKFHVLQDCRHTLSYYLNSCKIRLDSRSHVVTSKSLLEYLKEKQANKSTLSNKGQHEDNRGKIEEQIADSAIGLEHILREAGQMYEAVISEEIRLKELEHAVITLDVIHKFPVIAAGLLLMGQPLELMDGDASNVAITWVDAVLNQIGVMTNNARVFVLSVIGVQSSGKSTLLNALFGLQFPVSAGRCTRGIFCHLVPVDKGSLQVAYDYILVVDTEGLRAKEFGEKSTFRDNELATFAIGLADATIINMKGENWAEMNDILQIAAHGLIRVRKTKVDLELMPRCMFVHQNVSAPDAKEKNLLGQDKQLSLLDTAIKAAGRAEGFSEITKFNQVIKYDTESHSWYFPDLWSSRPPKARISQDYIKQANELRQHIIQVMKDSPSKLMISGFLLRVTDLWNAILHNDFVLCFRNTQEIIAGTVLNDRISHEVDNFKNLNNHAQTEIRESISSFANVSELGAKKGKILKNVSDAVDQNFKKMNAALQVIIDATDISSVLKEKHATTLIEIKDGERLRINSEIEKEILVHQRKLEYNNDRGVVNLKTELHDLEKHIEKHTEAVQKHNQNEAQMKEFEKKWQQLIDENIRLINKRKELVQDKIKREIRASVKEFDRKGKLNLETLSWPDVFKTPFFGEVPKVNENDIVQKHGRYTPTSNWTTKLVMDLVYSKSYVHQANRSINMAYTKWELQFENQRGLEFETSQLHKISYNVGHLLGMLEKREREAPFGTDETYSSLPPGYSYSHDYLFRFIKFVCHYTYNRFHENNETFISLTDPLADIDDRRQRSLSRFQQMSAEANIDAVSKQIFDYAERSFVTDLGELIKGEVCKAGNDNPTFKSKREFLKTILRDLGEKTQDLPRLSTQRKKIFEEFMLYVQMAESNESKNFFHSHIIKLLKDVFISACGSEFQTVFRRIVENNIGRIIEKATNALKRAEENCKGCSKEYIQIFKDYMDKTSEIDFSISTLSGFTVTVVEKINNLYADFLSRANSSFEELVRKDNKAAIRSLFEKIMGCREKCPFCSAPCSESLEKHAGDHRANHYPMGVRGTVVCWGLFTNTQETIDATSDQKKKPRKLSLSTCQAMVGTRVDIRTKVTVDKATRWYQSDYHSFKKYKDLREYCHWDIPYSRDHNASLYWKWFMAQFGKELADYYSALCPEIPEAWLSITWEEARRSLIEPDENSYPVF